jgi:hypothetical protein
VVSWQDVDNKDNNYNDDVPHEADLEGRVVKYIGVIMKLCICRLVMCLFFAETRR